MLELYDEAEDVASFQKSPLPCQLYFQVMTNLVILDGSRHILEPRSKKTGFESSKTQNKQT